MPLWQLDPLRSPGATPNRSHETTTAIYEGNRQIGLGALNVATEGPCRTRLPRSHDQPNSHPNGMLE